MSDDQKANEQQEAPDAASDETTSQAEREAGAWDEVAHALDELGQAVTAWTRALKDDPETRRHASDLKDGFERLGRQMGDTLDSATDTEFGRGVSEAAGRAGAAVGDAARKAGDQVAPFVIGALRGAAEGIRRAADGLEARTGSPAGDESVEGEAVEPPPAPQPPPVPESPESKAPEE